MNEKGALKWVAGFEIKPIDIEVRVMDAYKLFADEDAEKAYQILDGLHNEIEALSNEIQLIPTEIR